MKSKKYLLPVLVALLALTLAACAGKKEAATTALTAAENAFEAVKGELVKYVPDEAKLVEDAIVAAKNNLANNNFDAVITAVKDIPAKVNELIALAETKKAELTRFWEETSAGMPGKLDAIKTKLDALFATKRLPAGLDKTTLEGAKTSFDEVTAMWTEAQTSFTSGDVADAATKANAVNEKINEVMVTIGLKQPLAAIPGN